MQKQFDTEETDDNNTDNGDDDDDNGDDDDDDLQVSVCVDRAERVRHRSDGRERSPNGHSDDPASSRPGKRHRAAHPDVTHRHRRGR